jgi:nucleoside-diphosphate-sugar epimerase
MSSMVILGAGGFLGRHLLSSKDTATPIKAVVRSAAQFSEPNENIAWHALDLSDSEALSEILEEGDSVINLAYIADGDSESNLRLIDGIITASVRSKVSRLIHCSTAVVAGATSSSTIDESTPCSPFTSYERTKWEVEQRVLSALSSSLDIGILRPTAIVGPGGANLLKPAASILAGRWLSDYLRACLYGERPMHLVPAGNVAAALLFLADATETLKGNIYIAAADDDPHNNFQAVEKILRRALGIGERPLPPLPIPAMVLSLLLRLLGRSDWDMKRRYLSTKLESMGFVPPVTLEQAIVEFAGTLRPQVSSPTHAHPDQRSRS